MSPEQTTNESLAYYKTQYEQLEAELADFQASSRELESELERDIEASEKRERQLQEKVDSLGFEVNEWKTKYKQSKAEANTAQNVLQKEITTLRDINRTIQLKLRDIEVANDDYEKQARNTTSSLEDLESKYNISIERSVMMEEEIKSSEQDREALRIEAQRLRDELSDLRIEADIRQDKLRKAETAALSRHAREPKTFEVEVPRSPTRQSDHSPVSTTTSSPTIVTPPTKSASSIVSETPTPPSPPTSDHSVPPITNPNGPARKARLSSYQTTTTSKPTNYSRPTHHNRDPSISLSSTLSGRDRPIPYPRRTTLNRQEKSSTAPGLPTSQSLHTVRGLMGKMASLQERVNSARSKLPAPTTSSPHSSPRNGSAMGQAYIPPTITLRSNKKRISVSNVNSSVKSGTDQQSISRPASRLSFGFSHPSVSPEKVNDNNGAPSKNSRPTSRHSISSRTSISHLPSAASASAASHASSSRPSSRQSLTGPRTPYNQTYNSNLGATISKSCRPRSSIGGSYATMHAHHGHGHSQSVNRLSIQNSNLFHHADPNEEDDETSEVITPTPARRNTAAIRDDFHSSTTSSLVPSSPHKRASGIGISRRMSSGLGLRQKENADMVMAPPALERRPASRLSDTEETF